MATPRDLRAALLVKPGTRVRLEKLDPGATHGFDKESAAPLLERQLARLTELAGPPLGRVEALGPHRPAGHRRGRQGRHDPEGHGGVQPAGLHVSAFKVPSTEELAHDYLWRIHKRVPGKGEIGIFNRSHYEDVLVVRVHDLVPTKVWKARYDQINAFERHLADERHDHRQVLPVDRPGRAARAVPGALRRPDRHWKFSMGDLEERKRWDDYQAAFDEALTRTSTAAAPWYVIPANRKWFRNLAVASILADTLADLRPRYPAGEDLPPNLVIE